MAFVADHGKHRSVIVPAGSTVEVVSSADSQMAEVLWDGQTLTMFVLDLGVPDDQAEEPQRPI